jgi:hypothetical protein
MPERLQDMAQGRQMGPCGASLAPFDTGNETSYASNQSKGRRILSVPARLAARLAFAASGAGRNSSAFFHFTYGNRAEPTMTDALAKTEPKEHWVSAFSRRARGVAEDVVKRVDTSPTTKPYVKGALDTVGTFAEGAVVGSLLGAARGMFGDDTSFKAAAASAGILSVVAVAAAGTHPGVAEHARIMGGQATAVASSWWSEGVTGGKRHRPTPTIRTVGSTATNNGSGIHGEDTDPVAVAAARPQKQ